MPSCEKVGAPEFSALHSRRTTTQLGHCSINKNGSDRVVLSSDWTFDKLFLLQICLSIDENFRNKPWLSSFFAPLMNRTIEQFLDDILTQMFVEKCIDGELWLLFLLTSTSKLLDT